MRKLIRTTALTTLVFAVSAAALSAQATVTVTSITDPVFLSNQLQQVQSAIKTATSAVAELQYAQEIYQGQLQTLQSLGQGDWQGILDAMGYETQAINTYSSAVQNLPTAAQILGIQRLAQEKGYQQAALQAQNLARSFDAADQALLSTNSLIQDTKYREQEAAKIMTNAAQQKPGSIQLAQDRIEQLQLIQDELSDTNMALGSFQNYLTVQEQNQKLQQALFDAQADRYQGLASDPASPPVTYQRQEPDASSVDASFLAKLQAAQ